ncbi:hypothetical protein DMC01_02325 [Campylobacter troglodytis]|nr:hypothetical protein DMC01_02325 [Campylobacter troglodytis]
MCKFKNSGSFIFSSQISFCLLAKTYFYMLFNFAQSLYKFRIDLFVLFVAFCAMCVINQANISLWLTSFI